MKHSPGPWTVTQAEGELLKPLYVKSADEYAVCQMRGMNINDAWSSQTWANAHLIAVAPELLSALRLMVETFSKCSSPAQGGSDPFTWLYMKEFAIANEAIKKATQ